MPKQKCLVFVATDTGRLDRVWGTVDTSRKGLAVVNTKLYGAYAVGPKQRTLTFHPVLSWLLPTPAYLVRQGHRDAITPTAPTNGEGGDWDDDYLKAMVEQKFAQEFMQAYLFSRAIQGIILACMIAAGAAAALGWLAFQNTERIIDILQAWAANSSPPPGGL